MSRKKPSKITVLLDPKEFDRFEAYCKSQGFKKSTLITRLIREFLDTAGFHVKRLPASRQPARQPGSSRR